MADSSGNRGGSGGSNRNRNRSTGGASGLLIAIILVVIGFSTGRGSGGPSPSSLGAAEKAARSGQYTTAWRMLGLTPGTPVTDRATNCAAHSYGQVTTFFQRTPCRLLRRKQLTLSDGHGNSIRVLICWVTMSSPAGAASAKTKLAASGSGDISPLRGGRFDGRHYRSRRAGAMVVTAEAMAATGHPSAGALDNVADVGKEYPDP